MVRISGSEQDLPARRLREPTVFVTLPISIVFAASPMNRFLGPKPTRELERVSPRTKIAGQLTGLLCLRLH